MPTASPDAVLTDLVDGVARDGYAVASSFLPEATVEALRLRALEFDAGGALAPAGIGRAGKHRLATDVRGDRIAWLPDPPGSPAEVAALAALESLRVAMNRGLMMGLERLEAHYAVYPPGARYARHLDRFRDDDARVLSCVLYLNRAWRAEDGGALRLFVGGDVGVDVLPEGGTLVAFLAGRFEHEVLPARRTRVSLTGWFSRRQC
ncbi:MAG TPA: 2OG-Fe(II) oxygenase [Casimicrobiaceae bacterium]|nr:2OG-Fe(II) oxygenase [Casimicrobiaceae bacterium]